MAKTAWDDRYSVQEYIYGEKPNQFFSEQIALLIPGIIILPCDGEGRNGVYAATKGWIVRAFDASAIGKAKALMLARKKHVELEYLIKDAEKAHYPENSADVVAFIYAHFPPKIRQTIHKNAIKWLKPGGKLILEAFNPDQLKNTSGGPKDLSMVYTKDMLEDDFKELKIELLETKKIILEEGPLHQGKADVIQLVASKLPRI
jgi:SAM-dependent methyltransferase